jgi:hypothetical protein
MPTLTQAEVLRRGIDLARLLVERPHRVVELAAALHSETRSVERLLEGLREAGVKLTVEVRGRERYHSIRAIPLWLARAARTLGAARPPP